MKTEEIKEKILKAMQDIFNTEAIPEIKKEMKRLKIKSIEQSMGVDFITLNNGNCYSDTEFTELSEVKEQFYENYINVWNENPYYSTINHDIKL